MLNWVFLLLVAGAVVTGAFTDRMKDITDQSFASAKSAVDLAFGLIGQMALWLGFMKILQQAGLMRAIGRGLKPIMRRLFPEVPAEHPAMGYHHHEPRREHGWHRERGDAVRPQGDG